ncbi:MAG: hypothetical protein IPK71_26110 [Myxococcales bacterium]|nr:hypothetical protein [Myxococcales bacterium]
MKRHRRTSAVVALALGALGVLVACSTPEQGRTNATTLDLATFRPVSNMLVVRCGSLDCHGSRYRNYRLVGPGAGRLEPTATPEDTEATDAEVAANYGSTIGVEPETMREVAAARGAGAERLTLVRKARGEEAHKGDRRIAPGDAADRCLLSWTSGATDTAACTDALASEPTASPTTDAGRD